MLSRKEQEVLLVVPTNDLMNAILGDKKQGFIHMEDMSAFEGMMGVLTRGFAETDENYKQLISSIVIERGDELFVYERLGGSGEQRLHNKKSLTVGGHMNPMGLYSRVDALFYENSYRELNEEVKINYEYDTLLNSRTPNIDPIGLINDDSDEVGRVHVGVVMRLSLPKWADVEVLETDTLKGYFIDKSVLKETYKEQNFENWSNILLEELL